MADDKQTITLAHSWTYLTPLATVDYPAGVHRVLPIIAEAAHAAGVTVDEQEESDGDGKQPAKARKARAADSGEG